MGLALPKNLICRASWPERVYLLPAGLPEPGCLLHLVGASIASGERYECTWYGGGHVILTVGILKGARGTPQKLLKAPQLLQSRGPFYGSPLRFP